MVLIVTLTAVASWATEDLGSAVLASDSDKPLYALRDARDRAERSRAVLTLIRGLGDPKTKTRAIQGLAMVPESGKAASDALAVAINDKDMIVRINALTAIRQLDKQTTASIEALVIASRAEDWVVRLFAAQAIVETARSDTALQASLQPTLSRLMMDSDPQIRLEACNFMRATECLDHPLGYRDIPRCAHVPGHNPNSPPGAVPSRSGQQQSDDVDQLASSNADFHEFFSIRATHTAITITLHEGEPPPKPGEEFFLIGTAPPAIPARITSVSTQPTVYCFNNTYAEAELALVEPAANSGHFVGALRGLNPGVKLGKIDSFPLGAWIAGRKMESFGSGAPFFPELYQQIKLPASGGTCELVSYEVASDEKSALLRCPGWAATVEGLSSIDAVTQRAGSKTIEAFASYAPNYLTSDAALVQFDREGLKLVRILAEDACE